MASHSHMWRKKGISIEEKGVAIFRSENEEEIDMDYTDGYFGFVFKYFCIWLFFFLALKQLHLGIKG